MNVRCLHSFRRMSTFTLPLAIVGFLRLLIVEGIVLMFLVSARRIRAAAAAHELTKGHRHSVPPPRPIPSEVG